MSANRHPQDFDDLSPDLESRMVNNPAERGVLGAVLIAGEGSAILWADLATSLSAEDFHNPAHGIIWTAQGSLSRKRIPIDTGLLANELAAMNRLNTVGGNQYIDELSDTTVTTANVRYHAQLVADHAQRRRIYRAARFSMQKALECYEVKTVADFATSQMREACGVKQQSGGAWLRDLAEGVFRAIEDASEGRGRGVKSGIVAMDELLGRLRPKQSIVLAARTSHGKTTYATQIAQNVAATGKSVLLFSLEMDKSEVMTRMACCDAGVDFAMLENNRVTPEQLNTIAQGVDRLMQLPIYIVDTGCDTVDRIESIVLREKLCSDVGLVIVDYLQLLKGIDKKASLPEKTEANSKACKMAAQHTDLPWVILSQFNREGAKADEEPTLENLRGSGSIGNDANTVIILHRPPKVAAGLKIVPTTAIIAKNRGGRVGRVELEFDLAHGRFDAVGTAMVRESDAGSDGDGYSVGGRTMNGHAASDERDPWEDA